MRQPLASDLGQTVRPSTTVAEVARMLTCHPDEIRKMLRRGELEGHRKGIRGVRIFLDSVVAYQQFNSLYHSEKPKQIRNKRHRLSMSNAAFREAMERAKKLGIV